MFCFLHNHGLSWLHTELKLRVKTDFGLGARLFAECNGELRVAWYYQWPTAQRMSCLLYTSPSPRD